MYRWEKKMTDCDKAGGRRGGVARLEREKKKKTMPLTNRKPGRGGRLEVTGEGVRAATSMLLPGVTWRANTTQKLSNQFVWVTAGPPPAVQGVAAEKKRRNDLRLSLKKPVGRPAKQRGGSTNDYSANQRARTKENKGREVCQLLIHPVSQPQSHRRWQVVRPPRTIRFHQNIVCGLFVYQIITHNGKKTNRCISYPICSPSLEGDLVLIYKLPSVIPEMTQMIFLQALIQYYGPFLHRSVPSHAYLATTPLDI